MHIKGTIIPLGTTSECFNKGIHAVIHAGGNAWVRRMWILTRDGETWVYPTGSRTIGKVTLIKRAALLAWEVA